MEHKTQVGEGCRASGQGEAGQTEKGGRQGDGRCELVR